MWIKQNLVTLIAVAVEALIAACWTVTLVLMCLPKGKNFRKLFVEPPYEVWVIGAVVAIVEM